MSAVLSSPADPPSSWRQASPALGLVIVALLLMYRDTFAAMVGIWSRSGTFAHAFLVPPISLWLIWRRQADLAAFNPRPQPWVLLPVAAAALAWLVGDMAGVNAITQLAATALLVLAVPAVLGWAVAQEVAFPLAFLFFMVPFGEFLMPALMTWTADVTVFALTIFGVPVYREGLQFVIPSGTWSVIEACSGVRYLIASFMVGTLFAYLNYRSTKRRLLFAAVALVVPVVANWARAVLIVMLGHLSNNRLAAGVDHIIYGWVFFGIVVMLMFFIGARWSEVPAAVVAPPAEPAPDGDVGITLPWVAAGLVILVLGLPHAAAWQLEHQTVAAPVLSLPGLPGVTTEPGLAPLNEPISQGPAAEATRVYGSGAQAVTVHVAYYRQQTYGHKLVNSENVLVKSEGSRWNKTASGETSITIGGRVLNLRTAELRAGGVGEGVPGQRLQVRQTYWVDGRFTTSDHWAAALGVLGRLTGRGDDGAALTFYMAEDDAGGAGKALDAFVGQHLDVFASALAAVRAKR
jgi:exosortase A